MKRGPIPLSASTCAVATSKRTMSPTRWFARGCDRSAKTTSVAEKQRVDGRDSEAVHPSSERRGGQTLHASRGARGTNAGLRAEAIVVDRR